MRRPLPYLLLWLSLGPWPTPASSAPALAPEVAEVRDCAKRNLPERSARQRLVLERSVAGSKARRLETTLLWKRGKDGHWRLRVTVDAPEAERGTAFLLIERDGDDDMFSYLPELRKVRRITSRAVTGSFLGSDVSYEDLQHLQGMSDRAKVTRLPDGEIDGRPAYVLEAISEDDSPSAYERVRSWIDRETCVLLRAELSGRHVDREIAVAWGDVKRDGEHWIPGLITLSDRIKNSQTRLSILDTEWNPELSDMLFTEAGITRSH